MTTLRKYWKNTQGYIWLVGGVLCLFVALIFWAGSDSSEELVEVNKKVEKKKFALLHRLLELLLREIMRMNSEEVNSLRNRKISQA